MISIIFYKIQTFVVLMLIGFIATKVNILKEDNLSVLSGLLVKIAFPCLGFALIYDSGLSIFSMIDYSNFIIMELSLSAFLLIFALLSLKIYKLPNSTKQVHIIQTMFGNQGFINMPILLALYVNGEAAPYITIFSLVDQILLWSLGVIILSSSSHENGPINFKNVVKKVCNPMIVSMLIAIIFTTFNIKIPQSISSTITVLGNTSLSWALIFLGAVLSFVSFKNLKYIPAHFLLVVVKMVCIPILVGIVTRTFLVEIESTILVLMAAMPAMSAISMLSKNYHSDFEYASQTILIMTASSVVTIPFVFYVLSFL